MTTGLDRTMLIVLFLVSHFNFFVCSVFVPSAFYCTLNTHYRIVSHRMGLGQFVLKFWEKPKGF